MSSFFKKFFNENQTSGQLCEGGLNGLGKEGSFEDTTSHSDPENPVLTVPDSFGSIIGNMG